MLLTKRFSSHPHRPISAAHAVGPWINIQLILDWYCLDLLKIFYSCWLSMLQYCISFLIIFGLILAIFADNLWFNAGFSCWLEDSLFLLINTRHKTLVWYFLLFLLDIASTISFLFWWSLVEYWLYLLYQHWFNIVHTNWNTLVDCCLYFLMKVGQHLLHLLINIYSKLTTIWW